MRPNGRAARCPKRLTWRRCARGYEQQRTLTTRLQAQQEELTAKRDAHDALVLDLEAAEQEAGQARAARDAAHQAHAAYALAEDLRPGEPCPVCLQPVTTLPGHAHAARAGPGQGRGRRRREEAHPGA